MSFTNAQLATQIADLISYWSTFNSEYSDWIGGEVGGGPNTDGDYPLTNWAGDETLLACPAQLADDVTGYVAIVDASAVAAAASAAAALVSENAADADATIATAQAVLADADRVDAEAAAAESTDSKNTSVTQANLATDRAGYAEEWAITVEDTLVTAAAGGNEVDEYSALHWAAKSAADAVATAADVIAAAASAAAALVSENNAAASEAAINPALLFTLADDETVAGNTIFSGTVALNGVTTLGATLELAGNVINDATSVALRIASGNAFTVIAGGAYSYVNMFIRDAKYLRIYNAANDDYSQMWHNGTNMKYQHVNTANIEIEDLTGGLKLMDGAFLRCFDDTNTYRIQINHNTTDVLFAASAATDFKFTGATASYDFDNLIVSDTGDSDEWNTAYGWGDHASGGYAPTASPTFTGVVQMPEDLDAPYGIHGGYADGGDANFGATIWGLDTAYSGGTAGNDSVSTSLYGLKWLRTSHDDGDANLGEGIGIFVNGVRYAQFGHLGAWFSGQMGTSGYGTAALPTFLPNRNSAGNGMYTESSNVLAFSTASTRQLQLYATWALFTPPIKTIGANTNPGDSYSSLSTHMLHIDGKEAIDGNDTWLRLNQNNDFTAGVYSPYAMRIDGNITANGNIVGDGATTLSSILSVTLADTGIYNMPGTGTGQIIATTVAGSMRLSNGTQYGEIGCRNSSYFHLSTTASAGFYFYDNIVIVGTENITKASHGNYLYHQSTSYDNNQNGGITFSTSGPSGGTTGDIWFEYTA